MSRSDKALARAKNNPQNVKWSELEALCKRYFGSPIRTRGSHVMFQLPWDETRC